MTKTISTDKNIMHYLIFVVYLYELIVASSYLSFTDNVMIEKYRKCVASYQLCKHIFMFLVEFFSHVDTDWLNTSHVPTLKLVIHELHNIHTLTADGNSVKKLSYYRMRFFLWKQFGRTRVVVTIIHNFVSHCSLFAYRLRFFNFVLSGTVHE